uniref:Uncharacterized protein n=1 Tax=Aegilops tauschii subsp. strangulata TaxID=200361 RepID=A0A453QDL1_AEGTS
GPAQNRAPSLPHRVRVSGNRRRSLRLPFAAAPHSRSAPRSRRRRRTGHAAIVAAEVSIQPPPHTFFFPISTA